MYIQVNSFNESIHKKKNKLKQLISMFLIFVLCLFYCSTSIKAEEEKIQQNNETLKAVITTPKGNGFIMPSGDKQYANAKSSLDNPLVVQVLDAKSNPIENYEVYFSFISQPNKAKDASLSTYLTKTDKEGYAKTKVTLGSKPGTYVMLARIHNGAAGVDEIFFEANARKPNWMLMLVLGLFGGLAFFLFGINMLSEGMKNATGAKMRAIMSSLTKNRFMAVVVGIIVTVIFQSSSATTVLLVGFVQAGLMSFVQSLGIILGADIGTTMTVQLIAFKITDYVLLAIALGFLLSIISQKEFTKNIGQAIMGFGILFFGMHLMSDAMVPLRSYLPFLELVANLENYVLAILAATLFTALIQSSAAFIGIALVMASQGLISLETGIALSLGANIGTCITAALASLNSSREAKRVAMAHTLFKIFGMLLLVTWIPTFAKFIYWLSGNTASIERQIANAHTVFNVGITIVFLPFISFIAAIVQKILPLKKEEKEPELFKLALDENLLKTPVMALAVAKSEILKLGDQVKDMVEKSLKPIIEHKPEILNELCKQEDQVDFAQRQINGYLRKVSAKDLSSKRVEELFQLMHTVTDLEQIADIVDNRVIPIAEKISKKGHSFSDQDKNEIIKYHSKTIKQIGRCLSVFDSVNLEEAKSTAKKYQKYRLMAADFQRTQFNRVSEDSSISMATSELLLDLLDALKRISSHATNIARYMFENVKVLSN